MAANKRDFAWKKEKGRKSDGNGAQLGHTFSSRWPRRKRRNPEWGEGADAAYFSLSTPEEAVSVSSIYLQTLFISNPPEESENPILDGKLKINF